MPVCVIKIKETLAHKKNIVQCLVGTAVCPHDPWILKQLCMQAHQVEQEGLGDTAILLQTYLGLAWTLGCAAFGLVVVQNSVECRIARQYLCQAAVFMCGLSILALTAVHGNYHGYVMFAWIYGIFCGG